MSSEVVTYFDSSVILAMLFNQSSAEMALKHWEAGEHRVTSMLTAFECINVAQRFRQKLPQVTQKSWWPQAESWLSKILSQLNRYQINETVLKRMKSEAKLSQCRTLDAIHLATMLLYYDAGVTVQLVTGDKRMIAASKELGIAVSSI